MKYGVHSPILWRVLSVIVIGMLITCSSGCKFGKKINQNSNGVISVTRPDGQWINPNSLAKIEPPKSKPVKMTNKIARITLPKGTSAPSINKLSPIKGIGKPIKLKPSEVELLLPKFETSDPVKIGINIIPANESESGEEALEIVAVEEKRGTGVRWNELIAFYLIAALIGFLGWVGYGLYKDHGKVKSKWEGLLEPDDKKNTPDEKKELP
jgi:hypothetical protein